MASALTRSSVTILTGRIRPSAGRNITERSFDIDLGSGTGYGTTTNTIPASALGFVKILECSVGVLDTNANLVVAAPSLDGSLLLLKASATDAPADLTGTLRITVGGLL